MQTVASMNSILFCSVLFCSVLFCSVRDSRVLKSLSKNQNKLRTPSLGEVYPKIFSHNKDRYVSCVRSFLQAVFLRLFGNKSCSLCGHAMFYRRWRFALKNRLSYIWRITMAYTKPQIIAQNASSGSYAAGCPANRCSPYTSECKPCERTR